MKKKLLTMLLATAMVVSSLAACGGKDTSSSNSNAGSATTDNKAESKTDDAAGSSDEQITLRVADWEGDAINEAMQWAFDNIFEKEHPNIQVEIVPVPHNDYGQGINAMLTAGEAPDVFQYGYDQAKGNFDKGVLYDWTEKAAAEPEFVEGFYGGTMSGWTTPDGKVYGFPSLVNVYGVFYNKDILDAAGIAYPSNDWTWDDFFAMGQKLADPANNKYGIYADPTMLSSAFGIATMGVSEGGEPFVDKIIGTSKVSADDKFIAAAEKVKAAIAEKTLIPTTYETTNMLSEFEAGNIGMLFYGQWEIDSLVRNCPDLNWGYAATPKGSVQATTFYDTVGWAAPKDTKYPEECWELIKFMSTEMYASVLEKTPVAACAHIDSADVFYDAITAQGHEDAAEAIKVMMNTEAKTATRYSDDWTNDAGEVWNTEWDNFMNGSGTADVIPGIVDAVNNVIANY